jgi:acyl dehydratase
MPVSKLYFEDFKPGLFAEYGPRTISREEIVAFAAEFDPQPMHLDEEAARDTMLGGLSASGWHTCGLMMRMMCDGFLLNSSSMGANAVEEVQWLKPVRPGDTLHVVAKVLETRRSTSKPDRGVVRIAYTTVNQHGESVMTLVGNQLLRVRP